MTFVHGEILDLGLEEKNRALLGWPRVGVVRPRFAADEEAAQVDESPTEAAAPAQATTTAFAPDPASKSSELIPAL
jgi:hypothetical protein